MSVEDNNNDQKPSFLDSPNARWIALGSLGAVVVIGVIAFFAFGGTGGGTTSSDKRVTVAAMGNDAMVQAANDAASAESGGLCERALTRARSYGTVPGSSTLTSKETETEVKGRYTCGVKAADGSTFTLAVDQTCDDLGKHECVALHTVTQADGRTLFERQL